jgi:hypothetical protein
MRLRVIAGRSPVRIIAHTVALDIFSKTESLTGLIAAVMQIRTPAKMVAGIHVEFRLRYRQNTRDESKNQNNRLPLSLAMLSRL